MRLNGCHNRAAYTESRTVQDGAVLRDGALVPQFVTLPFRLRKDCSYTESTLGQADDRCSGCKWRKETPDEKL